MFKFVHFAHSNFWALYFGWRLTEDQDGAGWTSLMIAVSLKDGEDFVKLFLSKGADVNAKSELNSLNLIFQ
jgi:ankyrin repeat protein